MRRDWERVVTAAPVSGVGVTEEGVKDRKKSQWLCVGEKKKKTSK